MPTFEPGQLVICIEDHPRLRPDYHAVKKHRILTVRDTPVCQGCQENYYLLFQEFTNLESGFICLKTGHLFWFEMPYDPDYFAPLDTGDEELDVDEELMVPRTNDDVLA